MNHRGSPAHQPITGDSHARSQLPQPHRRSWPYVITAAIALTLQQGWNPQQVITLTTCLLALIALITSTGHNGE